MSESKTVIDAEFTDVDGSEKGGKRVLERVADIADSIADPLEHIGAEQAAERARMVGVLARDVDGLVEEARPIARKVESTIERMLKVAGLEDFDSRGVMRR